jgi:hypothetical protein
MAYKRGAFPGWVIFFCLVVSVVPAFAAPAWNYLPASGAGYGLMRGGASAVYDPVSNELIVFSGFSQDQGNPHLNDVWILSNANGLNGNGSWTNLIPNGTAGSPPGRHNHSAVYDSVNNRMVIYGGCEGGCYPIGYDLWVLSNANGQGGTPTWQQLSPQGTPPGRQGHQAVYDPNTNSMIVWGGQNGGGYCGGYTDVWVLSNANGLGGTPVWTQLSPSGASPAGDYFSSAAYDSVHNTLIVFGGSQTAGSCNGQATNTVYTLSHANGTGGTPAWTQVTTSGTMTARSWASMVYNPITNRMTVFGGGGATQAYTDTWVLSHANGIGRAQWTKLKPTFNYWLPSAGSRWNLQGLDVTNNRMIITLGGGTDPFTSTWVLTDADNR